MCYFLTICLNIKDQLGQFRKFQDLFNGGVGLEMAAQNL